MTTRTQCITSYQHLHLFLNEPLIISDTIAPSMSIDEYSGRTMLYINESNLLKEVKRCANRLFHILSITNNNDEHLIQIPAELLTLTKFRRFREKLFNKYNCSKIYRIPKLKIHNRIGVYNKITDCAIIKIRRDITSFQVIMFIKCMFEIFGKIDYDVYEQIVSIVKEKFLHQSNIIDYSKLENLNNSIKITLERQFNYEEIY
tara:strand:- start:563 stop:1171 length:609 start_codon:yes stop_codon:yes gene_type:complete